MKYNYPSIAKFQQFVELKDYRPPTKKECVRNVCKRAARSASILGHESLDTTVIYTDLTAISEARTQAALAKLPPLRVEPIVALRYK